MAGEVRPTLCPLIRAPSAVHRATCSSWMSYASPTVRPAYCSVSGSTGLRLAYAPSSTSAISTRVPWSTTPLPDIKTVCTLPHPTPANQARPNIVDRYKGAVVPVAVHDNDFGEQPAGGRRVPEAVGPAGAAQARGRGRVRPAAAGHGQPHPVAGGGPARLDDG